MTAIKWKTGAGGDWSTASDWTPGAVPGASDDVTIAATGTYTVTINFAEAANSLTLSAAHATISDNAALAIGGTLTASAGTFALASSGTLVGGTVSAAGGVFNFGGGTLSAVAWQGPLTFGASQTLYVENGLSVTGTGGNGSGTITLSAGNDSFNVLDNETLNSATLNFGNGSSDSLEIYTPSPNSVQTLTLGNKFAITQTGGLSYIEDSYYTGNIANNGAISTSGGSLYFLAGLFTNSGTISITGGTLTSSNATLSNSGSIGLTTGTFNEDDNVFTNAGTLSASGGTITSSASTFTNTGSIAVSGGIFNQESNAFINSAAISISGGQFNLAAGTAANNGTISVTAGTFNLATTLTATGLLAISGKGVFELSSGGLLGGTVTASGAASDFNGGTLSAATWQGPLTFGASQTLYVENGLSVTGTGGNGSGTITLSAGNDSFNVLDNETLNSATLNFGNGSSDSLEIYTPSPNSVRTLTLGNKFAITQTGGLSYIEDSYYTGNIANNGAISTSGGSLYFLAGLFTNSGTISITGGTLTSSNATLSNSGSIGLTTGTFNEDDNVFTNAGTLSASGGTITSSASTFTNTGSIAVSGGIFNQESNAFINSAAISISGGQFNLAAGTAANNGTISVTAGTFNLATTLTATGLLAISGKGVFELSSGGLLGGTVTASGAASDFNGGTLSAATWQGPLTFGASQTLYVENGLSVTGTGGNGNGTITLSAGNDSFNVLDNETLNNATLNFGNGSSDSLEIYTPSPNSVQTLTLGNKFAITQTGGLSYIEDSYYTGNIANNGAISTSGGSLYFLAGLFTNSGTISITGGTLTSSNATLSNSGSIGLTTGTFNEDDNVFTNAGTLSASGGTITSSASTFTNTGSIAVSGGIFNQESNAFINSAAISISGGQFNLAAGTAANNGTISVTAGTFNLATTLTATGLLAISGKGVFELSSGGLLGGTVTASGAASDFNGGTLSAATWQGPLTFGASQTLYVENGLSVTGTGGNGNGTITLSAGNDSFNVLDNETLNNATLNFGNGSSDSLEIYTPSPNSVQTLTLGNKFAITQTGGLSYIEDSYYTGNIANNGAISTSGGSLYFLAGLFTNSGTISITGGTLTSSNATLSNSGSIGLTTGTFNEDDNVFTNAGTLSASGGTITSSASTFTNTGSIAVSGGIFNQESNAFINSAAISISGGQFNLAAGTAANNGTISVTAGTFNLATTLTATGLLAISGKGVFELSSGGLLGGTVTASGAASDFNGGTLSAATWQGPLTFGGANQSLYVENGLSVTGTSGSGNGTITLSSGNDSFNVLDNETLNNATFSFGNGSNDYLDTYNSSSSRIQTLTLGSNFIVIQAGGTNYIEDGFYSGDLVNNGTIACAGGALNIDNNVFNNTGLVSVAGGTLAVSGSAFSNAGSIDASGGGLIISYSSLSGLKSGTLTGGSYEADAKSILQIYSGSNIGTDSANIILSGVNSVIEVYNTSTSANVLLETKLSTISSGGTLAVLANRNFAAAVALTNNGSLQLGGGNFSTSAFTNAAGAHVSGFGTISAGVANNGSLEATSGSLLIAGSITGTGTMQIDAGATLEIKTSSATGETVSFAGQGGVLKLDAAAGFASQIAGFAAGDAINIGTLVATGTSVGGTSLAVTLSNGTTLTETLTAPLANTHVGISTDGHTLTAYRFATASAHTPEPVAFGNVHVGDTVSQAIGITNTALADGYSENLDAAMGATTGRVTDAGTLFGLVPGASNTAFLSVGLNTSVAGAISGTALINLASDGSGVDGFGATPIGSQTANVTGAVYAYAAPSLANGGTVAVGNFHVGNSQGGFLTVTNAAATGGYSEALDASLAGAMAGFNASGSLSMLGAGASDSTSLAVGATASAGGTVSGTATLTLASDGTGIDGLGTTTLASQVVTITGTAYAYAAAQFATASINLGVVHVGSTAQLALSLANIAAANGYSEALDASFRSSTGAATYGGSLTGLAAGAMDSTSLLVGLNTSASGTYSGNDVLGLVSDGTGIDGLGTTGIGTGTIAVTGIVDNYALAAFQDVSSGQSITGSGTNFSLNLGSVVQGSASLVASIGALNAATGLADLLGGTITSAGGAGFTNTGFGTFSLLGAGQGEHGQSVTLSTSTAGTFTETIVLTSAGSNASGYSGALAAETLTLTGTITPAGSTTYVLAIGPNIINGADGGDVFQASAASLNSRDQLTGGNGSNVIQLTGGGSFDLGAPKVFANIPNVTALEGQAASKTAPATAQTVYLRDGASETLTVIAGTAGTGNNNPEAITLYGGTGNDTLMLAAGHDSAILYTGSDTILLGGAANSVTAGGGTALVQGTAANAAASVVGNANSTTTLEITTGGTVSLNASDTYLTVKLDAASKLTLGKLGFITADGSTGGDTLVGAGVNQTLIGGAGDILTGFTGGTDSFIGASAALNGDTIGNWTTGDVIDITDMNSATLKALTFKSGKLTVNDGTHTDTLAVKGLSGVTLAVTNFTVIGSDGYNGTLIGWHG